MASHVESNAFLLACLKMALGPESEVLSDIAEVCALENITAVLLASPGAYTIASAAEKLYLTESESERVLEICAREVAKASAGEEGGVTVRLSVSPNSRVVLHIIPAAPPSPAKPPSAAAKPPSAAAKPLAAQALPKMQPWLAPVVEEEHLPATSSCVVSRAPPPGSSSSAASSPRPVGPFMDLTASASKAFVPSYLRPTASSVRQTKKEREAATAREVKPEAAKPKKQSGMFARLGHTLVAPTAAFLARITGKKEENGVGADGKSVGGRLLAKVLDSPQGQRVTKPAAFRLAVDSRPKAQLISSDDMELAKAKEVSFKPHSVPRHVYEARPLEFRAASSPKLPQEVFVPFELASVQRHAARMKELRMEAEAEKVADEEARRFHAITWSKDKVGVESPGPLPKLAPQAVTVAKAFTFKSEARAVHYTAVTEPVKKAKEEAKEAEDHPERVEAARKARELADLSVPAFRRTLDFKAIHLPDFSAPFSPDTSLATGPTTPQAFALRTTARLGEARPTSAREDYQGHRLGFGAGAFAQSLRGSTTGSTMMSTAALRRSTNNPLHRSMGPLSHGGRSSVEAATSSSAARAASAAAARPSFNMSLRASLRASLTQGLKEAKLAAAVAAAAPPPCVAQEATSRRSTQDNVLSRQLAA